jgi:hypothetical protein
MKSPATLFQRADSSIALKNIYKDEKLKNIEINLNKDEKED